MILAAGLTPAWQQVLVLDALTPGAVNRARQVYWCASGKVLNAARALHQLGAPCQALTVAGGTPGQALGRDFARLGIAARWVGVSRPTRVCTTVLDTSRRTATEFVPEADPLTATELEAFLAAYAQEAASAAVVVLIGSLPTGAPTNLYRRLVDGTRGRVILDARGPELLEALAAKPFLVKPNREELGRTLGRELATNAALFEAMDELVTRGAEWVVVTDGKNAIHVAGRGRHYCLRPPLREVVNPIGCGDCMAGGIAFATFQGKEPLDAVRFGAAVAAEKVGQVLPGLVDPQRVEDAVRSVEVISH